MFSIQIEQNKRLGQGFQIRAVDGEKSKVFDAAPLSLSEAIGFANVLLTAVNREFHQGQTALAAVNIRPEALESAAREDVTVARMLRDARSKSRPDARKTVYDGEEQTLLSGRGAILFAFYAWRDDRMPKAQTALRRYCEFISMRGYRGGATAALEKLEKMDRETGAAWIRETFDRFVGDDASAVDFVFEGL